MDITGKKREIIQALQSLKDEHLIEEVYELLHPSATLDKISIESLPLELQSKINRALDDYKKGYYITHNEMKQKIEQWLTN